MQRSFERTAGFTLIELALTVGIIAALAAVSLPLMLRYKGNNDLSLATQSTATVARRAQTLSVAGNQDSSWGVYIQDSGITLFKGSSFAARDTAYDEQTTFSTIEEIQGQQEFVFDKQSGASNASSSVTLIDKSTNSTTVFINTFGVVSF